MWMAWVTLDTDLLKMKRKRIMKKYSQREGSALTVWTLTLVNKENSHGRAKR